MEAAGHTITEKWWLHENTPIGERDAQELANQAEKDIAGVMRADQMILMNTAKSEGKAIEQGVAIAEGIPIIAVGIRGEQSNNVFHYLPDYTWVPTLEDALAIIG